MTTGTLQIFAMGQDPQDPEALALAASYNPPLQVIMFEAIGPNGDEYEDIQPEQLADFIAKIPHDEIERH